MIECLSDIFHRQMERIRNCHEINRSCLEDDGKQKQRRENDA